jgi:hypothetical protein
MTRLAPLLFAAFLAGCAVVPPPRIAAAPAPRKSPPPGIVICLNAGLAERVKKHKPASGVVLAVVYSDNEYSTTYVLPDLARGRMTPELLMSVLKAKYPDRVIVLAMYPMPTIA